MNRPTKARSNHAAICLFALLAMLTAVVAAQTNDAAKDTPKQKPATKTAASKTTHAKTPKAAATSASGSPATPAAPAVTGAATNTPDTPGNSALTAPPGWVPAANAQKAVPANHKSSTSGSKPHPKKSKATDSATPKN